jgi:hypothetical protein
MQEEGVRTLECVPSPPFFSMEERERERRVKYFLKVLI